MTGADASGADDPPTWADLFERSPPAISETTVREVLADHRQED